MKEGNLTVLHTGFQLYDILEKQNYGGSKKMTDCQGLGWREGWLHRAQWTFYQISTLVGNVANKGGYTCMGLWLLGNLCTLPSISLWL